jgi:hypothetical protein
MLQQLKWGGLLSPTEGQSQDVERRTRPSAQHQWQASAGSKWRGGEERGRWHAMSSP